MSLQPGLDEPQVMIDAKDEYRVDEDIIQQFINEMLDTTDPKARMTRGELYNCYAAWAEGDGASAKTKRNFLMAFRKKNFKENTAREFHVGVKF